MRGGLSFVWGCFFVYWGVVFCGGCVISSFVTYLLIYRKDYIVVHLSLYYRAHTRTRGNIQWYRTPTHQPTTTQHPTPPTPWSWPCKHTKPLEQRCTYDPRTHVRTPQSRSYHRRRKSPARLHSPAEVATMRTQHYTQLVQQWAEEKDVTDASRLLHRLALAAEMLREVE